MIILHLKISSWIGSIGATHYYGRIIFPGQPMLRDKEDIELEFKLSQSDAEKLNRKEYTYAPNYRSTYQVGEWSKRFDTKEEIKIAGIKYYKEHLQQNYPLLVLGNTGVIEPQEIIGHNLESPEQVKLIRRINEIAKKYDYDDNCDSKLNTTLFKKWEPLWKELTGESWN
jgi:hypothetical protein